MENTVAVNPQEKFIGGWSWGAFFLGFIWALASRLYLYGVLMLVASFIPVVNLAVWIYFAIAGKKVSWAKGQWESFEVFEKRQRLLNKIGLVVFLVMILLAAFAIVRFVAALSGAQAV